MPTPRIDTILEKYGFKRNAQTTWTVQGNPVIYHHILELIAIDLEVVWNMPVVIRAHENECVVLVSGTMDGKLQWTFGEARVDANYRVSGKQAAYVYAMAEKRAKDRLIYKFLGLADATEPEDMGGEVKTASGVTQQPSDPLTWDHPKYQGPGDKPANEMSVMDKLYVNIQRKKSFREIDEWQKTEPVQLALQSLTEEQRKVASRWARERADATAKDATSRTQGIWPGQLTRASEALKKAKNEAEVNSYESMMVEQEFAEAPADVIEAFRDMVEARRYTLRSK